jgi:small subunit ribosomal protein S21
LGLVRHIIHLVGEVKQKGFDVFMIKVTARPNESIEQLVKRFKKMCEKEGLTKDIKRSSYYEKPSERRRRRLRKMEKRLLKLQAQER